MTDNRPVSGERKRKPSPKKMLKHIFIYAMLILLGILFAYPFLWFLSVAIKSNENIYTLNLLPQNPTINNFIQVFRQLDYLKYTMNTVIITVGAILLDVIFSSLCAYPLACMEFKGKKFIFSLLVSAMIIPAAAGLIVNFITINALGLMGTFWGVILPGSVKVFSIIFFRQAYLTVPKEMIDAAKIDGAGEIRTWWQIMFPSITPAISTIVIFDFIGRWNDFLWPQIVFSYDTDKYPLATALKWLEGPLAYNTSYIAAGAVMSMIPILILFFLFQKNYIEAISGAVKG